MRYSQKHTDIFVERFVYFAFVFAPSILLKTFRATIDKTKTVVRTLTKIRKLGWKSPNETPFYKSKILQILS